MNRIARWGFALALFPIAACTTGPVSLPASTTTSVVAPPPSFNAVDQQFALQAAASDQFEIQSSQTALQTARNPRVRRFAQHMIDAHTQTTQQLTQIASSKAMPLQPSLDGEQQKMVSDLQGMSAGRALDRAYLHDQFVGHDAAVKAFQNEIDHGSDPDLKAFAQNTLPHIQDHIREARRIGAR
jgi:putative membrane protein